MGDVNWTEEATLGTTAIAVEATRMVRELKAKNAELEARVTLLEAENMLLKEGIQFEILPPKPLREFVIK